MIGGGVLSFGLGPQKQNKNNERNHPPESRVMLDMVMQQLAAASPKMMGQRPELKFVSEQGETAWARLQQ